MAPVTRSALGWGVGAQPCCAQGPTNSILVTLLLPLSTAQHRAAEGMSDEEKGKNERAFRTHLKPLLVKLRGDCLGVFNNSYENSVAWLLCVSDLCLWLLPQEHRKETSYKRS